MATSTAIGYNTGSTLTGTQKIGNLAVVTATTANPSLDPGGVKFWMGPDESLGYCIGIPVPSGTQSTPIVGLSAFLGFIRSSALTESSFVQMTNSTFGQSFTGGTQCKTYLNNNGYWTSWGNPYTPILDTYSGATAAYSLRKLSSTYTGSAIRVQRSSDSTQQDIGFVDNELDVASLNSFVGAGTGTVVTWYDQSGNNYDCIKNGSVGTPDIIVAGTTQTLNNKTALYFNGSKTLVSGTLTNLFGTGKTFISFGVGSALDTTTRLMLNVSGGALNSQAMRRNGNFLEAIAYNNNQASTFTDIGNVNVGTSQFIACTERNVTTIQIFTNTQSNGATSGTGTADGTNTAIVIGSFNPTTPSFAWNGYMQELIVFGLVPSGNTTYMSSVSSSLNSYYNTY